MSLYDAAVVQEIMKAIDTTLAAITPVGVNPNIINQAYPALAKASAKARDLYARIIEEHPIVATEVSETKPEAENTNNEQHEEKECGETV